MDFFKEERAVLSAIFSTLKLGFTMALGKKTTSLPQLSPKTIATADEQHRKPDGTKLPPTNTIQWQVRTRELSSLNSSLYENGAMAPFHSLFDAALLSPRADDLERSSRSSICPEPLNSSFDRLNSSIHNDGAMIPFRASFPAELLSLDEDVAKGCNTDAAPSELQESAYHDNLNISLENGGSMTPSYMMLGPDLLQDDSDSSGSLTTDGNSTTDSDGHTSPTLSFYASHLSSSASDNLPNTRKSSWATTIDSSGDEDYDTKLSTEHMNVIANPSDVTKETNLLVEYQHYNHLITVESPGYYSTTSDDSPSASDSTHDTSQITNESEDDIKYVGTPEEVAPEDPIFESYEQDEASAVEDKAAICVAEEKYCLAEESLVGDESSMYEDGSSASLPASPEEAAAWAHSHCPTNPEGTRVKILKDQHGQEYVLYHDCFHCLPKTMAPEFADEVDDESAGSSGDENFEDVNDDKHEYTGTYEDGELSDEDSEG